MLLNLFDICLKLRKKFIKRLLIKNKIHNLNVFFLSVLEKDLDLSDDSDDGSERKKQPSLIEPYVKDFFFFN